MENIPAANTPSGWADIRLSQAYELVAAVQKDCGSLATNTPIKDQLGEALTAIEYADGMLVLRAHRAASDTGGTNE